MSNTFHYIKIIYFQEHQIVHSLSDYVKKDDLLPIESKISFIEKLVCSKMEKLKLKDETSSVINVFDDTLKTNDVLII